MTLLKNFKEQLIDYLLDVAWSHWTKLGIPGQEQAAEKVNVDPEALLLLTGFLASGDLRLFDNVLGWLITEPKLVFKSRLKKILTVNHAMTLDALSKLFDRVESTTNTKSWQTIADQCRDRKNQLTDHGHEKSSPVTAIPDDPSYTISEANLNNNRVVLRKLFGTSVRAELLNFMLCGGEKNSNGMANTLFLSQSTIYTTLDDLVVIGIAQQISNGSLTTYKINENTFSLNGLREEIFFDWANFFRSIIMASNKLESLGETNTDYKQRSAINTFNETFLDNLSGWNRTFANVHEQSPAHNIMEMENPASHALNNVTSLPDQAMDQTFSKVPQ